MSKRNFEPGERYSGTWRARSGIWRATQWAPGLDRIRCPHHITDSPACTRGRVELFVTATCRSHFFKVFFPLVAGKVFCSSLEHICNFAEEIFGAHFATRHTWMKGGVEVSDRLTQRQYTSRTPH